MRLAHGVVCQIPLNPLPKSHPVSLITMRNPRQERSGGRGFFGGGPFAFFLAGVALLAIAYRASRRQLFGGAATTATHAALQPEYSPSSPRITYDRAAAAAASVAAQHQQRNDRGGRRKWGPAPHHLMRSDEWRAL